MSWMFLDCAQFILPRIMGLSVLGSYATSLFWRLLYMDAIRIGSN